MLNGLVHASLIRATRLKVRAKFGHGSNVKYAENGFDDLCIVHASDVLGKSFFSATLA